MPTEPIPPLRRSRAPGGFLTTTRPLSNGGRDWRGGVNFPTVCDGRVGSWGCEPPGHQEPIPGNDGALLFALEGDVPAEGCEGYAVEFEYDDGNTGPVSQTLFILAGPTCTFSIESVEEFLELDLQLDPSQFAVTFAWPDGPITITWLGDDWPEGVPVVLGITPLGGEFEPVGWTIATDTEDPVPETPVATKVRGTVGDGASFDSFLLYYDLECDGGHGWESLEELVQLGLTAGDSAAMAREIHANLSGNGNPSLQSTAVDVTLDAGAQPLEQSLQGLLAKVADCDMGELTIHVPVQALPAFLAQQLVVWDGTRFKHGPFDVIFDAYPNVGPEVADNDEPDPETGEVWIYATGLVEREQDREIRTHFLEHRLNRRVQRAERLAIVRFDPCCVTAVKALVS